MVSVAASRRRTTRTAPPQELARRGLPRWVGIIVGILVLAAASVVSIMVGNHPLNLDEAVSALTQYTGSDTDRVVRYIRVPRTLTGILAGIALGLAGAVMQGLTRNPLAGPGILGINAGAAFAVVVAMSAFGITALTGYIWFAFLGAAVAAVFVYMLGSLGYGGATPVKLALAGAAFGALIGSLTTAISLLDRATFNEFRFWVVGSLGRADIESLLTVSPFIAIGALAAVGVSRALNSIALGDDMARSLGARVVAVRITCAIAVILLAGAATAIAGPIAFIGLVVPHIARALVGPDYRWIMAWCVVLAPTLVLLADVLGRIATQPHELQVGIVTALAGAPFFLYLVRNRKVAKL
ncbi:iron chelate uptake ABC transporter family permease subunit [Hoyosella rhizosphaerae]|nr:iron chelate uptake ABC transporter family permease subunit [Hoyosella rhizosphaerae]